MHIMLAARKRHPTPSQQHHVAAQVSQAKSGLQSTRLCKKNLKVIHYNGDSLPDSAIPAMLERMWSAQVDILIYIGSRRRGSSIGKSHYGEDKYFHFWSGIEPRTSQKFYMEGISIFVTVRFGLASSVVQERPISARLFQLRIRHPDLDCIVTGGYAVPMTKTFGRDKKYRNVASYNTARDQFWHEFTEAMDKWGNRSTHIIGIDANGTVGHNGPGVGSLHSDDIDYNGGKLMDLMRAFLLAAINTYRCDTFFHGTHYHAPTRKWRRIDYVIVSDRLLQGDLIRYVGVRPVKGLATTRLDHMPITAELDVRLSRKYPRALEPEPNVLTSLDPVKLADPELKAQYELALTQEFANYTHAGAISALLTTDVLCSGDAAFARSHMQDSVTIRNLWLESVLQKWAAKFFAKASDSDYRRSLAWSWQTDYSQETKNLIFKAHESAAAMQKAAIAFGIKQKNPNRILKCVDLLADGPPGRPPLRSPEVVVPHGPPREDIHNQLPALHNLLDPSSLEPGTSATGVLELQALALQAKEDQHAKRDAIRLDRIATVERVTELVLHAPSLKAKFHHAKLLMRRKGSPCLGSTSYDEPEVELERLIEHLQEPPRSVSLESPPTVLAELHREHAAQETHAVPQGVPLLAPTQDPAVAHISSDAVARALKQEKPLKSCLRGTAPTALLKLAGASLIPFLTSLFKLACLLHFLPDTACDATTILLPKAGARGQFSFRLICLLHRIWTVYTGTIANALRTVAITPDTLAYDLLATAFGFLPGCGTRHVLLMVRAVIHTIMQRKLAVTLLFLDLAKAFDSLDRSGFPAALAALQIAMGWTCMIETVHQHTLYTITAFGHRFRCRTLRGVRQGSREGPIIFLLVFALALRELGWVISATHDTLYAIYICEDGTIRRFNLLHITFADDTTLVLPTTNVAELGEIVAKLWSILRRYGLSLNWKKTVYMIVGGPTADHPDPGSPLTLPAQDGFP
ncbi:MAG TPA: hypothetical protein EYQ75_14940, partial [Planctomycetaceae bacterium]|nr:hypothetical protein [Planctomycetaceae bacterium]